MAPLETRKGDEALSRNTGPNGSLIAVRGKQFDGGCGMLEAEPEVEEVPSAGVHLLGGEFPRDLGGAHDYTMSIAHGGESPAEIDQNGMVAVLGKDVAVYADVIRCREFGLDSRCESQAVVTRP